MIISRCPGGAAGFDAAAARPRVVLHFHLSEAALRGGHGWCGPRTAARSPSTSWWSLGRTGCQVRMQPVWIPPRSPRSTATRSRSGCGLRSEPARSPTSSPSAPVSAPTWTWTTPSATCPGLRRATRADPAGQPRPDGPTRSPRRHPRRLAQTPARAGLLRAPLTHGYVYLVTNQGTLALGRTDFSAAVWKASKPKPAAIPA